MVYFNPASDKTGKRARTGARAIVVGLLAVVLVLGLDPTGSGIASAAPIKASIGFLSHGAQHSAVPIPVPGMPGTLEVDYAATGYGPGFSIKISTAARGWLVKEGSDIAAKATCKKLHVPGLVCRFTVKKVFGWLAGWINGRYVNDNPCWHEYVVAVGQRGVVLVNWNPRYKCPAGR
jgi:hypothetical protein